MQNADNPFAVHSSKAVGEPPFFLGCSVFFAIKGEFSVLVFFHDTEQARLTAAAGFRGD